MCVSTCDCTMSVQCVIKAVLTLTDCCSKRHLRMHHPLLVAIDDSLCGHGQRVALRNVLSERCQRLLSLQHKHMRAHTQTKAFYQACAQGSMKNMKHRVCTGTSVCTGAGDCIKVIMCGVFFVKMFHPNINHFATVLHHRELKYRCNIITFFFS